MKPCLQRILWERAPEQTQEFLDSCVKPVLEENQGWDDEDVELKV